MQTEIDIDESACMRSHSHFWVKTACFPVLRFLRIYTPASQAREFDAIHTSELDRSEIDLSPKRSECERSNANWDWSKDRSKRAWTLSQSERRSIWDRPQFALRKCSHSFRSILDRTQFAFERSHSDRFGLRSISDRSNSLVWMAPSSHKIVMQSQTVAGSLRSLRVYVNKIGDDCLPILCELAFTEV